MNYINSSVEIWTILPYTINSLVFILLVYDKFLLTCLFVFMFQLSISNHDIFVLTIQKKKSYLG